jgi:hypothetical protein
MIDTTAKRWRQAFAQGFIDGDNGREASASSGWYLFGWKVGESRARQREVA